MSSARDYFDAGIDALALRGGTADVMLARERFIRATDIDASMCDAWMGLIVTGDHSSTVLAQAERASATLHRETRRLGLNDTDLAVSITAPGFIEIYPYTPASLTLAYIGALLTEREFDAAAELLVSYDPDIEPQHSPIWRCLGMAMHYVTRRWPDVLRWADKPVSAHIPVVGVATDLMAGIAHVGLGQYDQALTLLAAVSDDRINPTAAASAAHYRGLALRALGRGSEARSEFTRATDNGRLMEAASHALADETYGAIPTTAEAIAARTDPWDPASEPSTDDLQREEQTKAAERVLGEADRELESFIGLHAVKAHINELKYVQVYDRAMAARGVDVGQRNALHMTLIGPPGTAKSSIARIMCKMYFGLGILQSPDFIEVSRKELVGSVIGETEKLTAEFLKKARGRALFVDEAPDLYKEDNERDFGRNALDVIMKFAEDHRDDTMIALAGYPGGMNRLLSANPGLRSRFPTQLEFTSNGPDELADIATLFATEFRVILADEALYVFHDVARWLTATSTDNSADSSETLIDIAGNGRFVRNVLGAATKKMKWRVAADPSIDLASLDLNSAAFDRARTITHADMASAITDVLNSANIKMRH
jgi:type VII secretion ATPase EccA